MQTGNYELVVHTGPQAGARTLFVDFDSQIIGNTLDCDIYLDGRGIFDSDMADQRMELIRGNKCFMASLLRGDAMIDNKAMQPGKSYKLSPGLPLTLGGVEFSLLPFAPADADSTHTANDTTTDIAVDHFVHNTLASRISNGLQKPAVLFLLAAFAVVGTATAAFNSGVVNTPPQQTDSIKTNDIMEEIEHLEVGEVSVERVTPDNIIVAGTIKTSADQQRLLEAMRQRPEKVQVKTIVADEVADSVQEVFRAYGVSTDITKLRPGRIAVRTETNDLQRLASAEAAAKSDVYGLLELNVINNPPVKPQMPEKIEQASYTAAPGQAIRMMIYGNPSYVMTEDQSIFYEGALLPGGHRIVSILEDKVILSHNGKNIELNM